MLKIISIVAVLVAAFIIWRWMSVERGARKRDEKLISRFDSIGNKLDAGEAVLLHEIEALAARPENRYMLFAALRHMKRQDLLPTQYSSSVSQGESALAYWLMHPNEMQDAPDKIEFVETVKRPVNGQDADFHVYRYKMPAGNRAAKEGWRLGLAGPVNSGYEPYFAMPGAFSRWGDIDGKVKPSEIVDWYVGMLRKKGIVK